MEDANTKTARSILTNPALIRFALAHHPLCSLFAPDVVPAGVGRSRVPLCTGCVTFWPLLLSGVPVLLIGAHLQGVAWWALFLAGSLLGSAQLLSYARLTRTRRMKIVVKAAFGLGAALVVTAIILMPFPVLARIALGLFFAFLALLVQTRRLASILAVCDACPWQRDWQFCPGFAPINDHEPGRLPKNTKAGDPRPPQAWPWHPHVQERSVAQAQEDGKREEDGPQEDGSRPV